MGNSKLDDRLLIVEKLVDELMRARPRHDLVKNYMSQSGLVYSSDPIECIDKVLQALNPPVRSPNTDLSM